MISSAAHAVGYYEAEDYYAEEGLAPSEWSGGGARALGLQGEVARSDFKRLLEGEVAGRRLGTMQDGAFVHRPGWDLTFSAPKSVSVMAEVAGDRRLVAAHERAVRTALGLAEDHLAATRIRESAVLRREATGNLVIASFRHGTSRSLDPQLHSHNVILNMTRDQAGGWRSLEPRAFYQLQKSLGAIYRQELAAEVQRLGYAVEMARDSTFEIAGMSPQALSAFSQRAAQIEARLAERGKTREEASAAEKQTIALDTREAKDHVPHGELVAEWRTVADANGFDAKARRDLVAQAEARAEAIAAGADPFARELAADRALAKATASLGEREAVFSATALHEAAGRFAQGEVSHAEIAAAIGRAEKAAELVSRDYTDRRGAAFSGFTSAANIAHEQTLLQLEAQGRHATLPMLTPAKAAQAVAEAEHRSARLGHAWTEEQRLATRQILASPNQVSALQGSAGTAKTSTVLATIAREAQANGIEVSALAPTASAAQVLGDALGARADTLARHLLAPGRPRAEGRLWIVDEASLVSAKDMARLLTLAKGQRARVLLVGDTEQLGSVEAGAAFAQLQGAGMQTAHLTELLRQTNDAARAAVAASLEGDARKALAALDAGGGRVCEHPAREGRFARIASDYAALGAQDRRATLVIEPSREGRDALTRDIRRALVEQGDLGRDAIVASRLLAKDMTRAEAKDARQYDVGDVVRFARDYADKGVSRAEAYRVTGVDPGKGAVTLQGEQGRAIEWRLRQWGASHAQVYRAEAIELRTGDRLQFTRNDRQLGRVNGYHGEIVAIDQAARSATVRLDNKGMHVLALDKPQDQHIAHGYVATAFAAQGRTARQTLIHADSAATNLMDQKSFYVALSRAKEATVVYTADRGKLMAAIAERTGARQTAIGEAALAGTGLASSGTAAGKLEQGADLPNARRMAGKGLGLD